MAVAAIGLLTSSIGLGAAFGNSLPSRTVVDAVPSMIDAAEDDTVAVEVDNEPTYQSETRFERSEIASDRLVSPPDCVSMGATARCETPSRSPALQVALIRGPPSA